MEREFFLRLAISQAIAGYLFSGEEELERVPAILRHIANDYEKEIKKQTNDK